MTIREVKSPIHLYHGTDPVSTCLCQTLLHNFTYAFLVLFFLQPPCCCKEKLDRLADDVKGIKTTLSELKELMQQIVGRQPTPKSRSGNLPWYLESAYSPPKPVYSPPKPASSPPNSTPVLYPKKPVEKPWYCSPAVPSPQFSAGFLVDLKSQSCSRANFSAKLVRKLFSEEERRTSNVKGVLGKRKLNPAKLQQVKEAAMQMYPCESGENHHNAWTVCCKAIDECNRRLNKKMKENIPPQ